MASTMQIPQDLSRTMLELPRKIDALYLGAGTAETWTCPAGTRAIIISASAGIYVRVASAAAVPTDEITDGTGSLYINSTAQFLVEEGVAYSFIRSSGSATIVTIGQYA